VPGADDARATPPADSAEELYESAPCGYLSTLPDGLIVRVNQTFLDWTGYERAQLVRVRRFQDLLAIGSKIWYETHYAPLLVMQGHMREAALDFVRCDGRTIPALVNTTRKRDANGAALVDLTTVLDATERRRYERELLLARRKAESLAQAKSDLLAMLGHDIRSPLSALQMTASLLARGDLSSAQRKQVARIERSVSGLLELVSQILEVGRLESGTLSLERRPLDVREVVREVVESVAAKAEEKGLMVAQEVDDAVPAVVLGDPVKLAQVLTNLVGNSIKFTERGSVSVAVRTKEVGPAEVVLAFRVADTGIGIPAEELALIFEEYRQASYEIGRKYGGSGLGLAISRKLLHLHGSHMSVESKIGVGSTFSFDLRLPRAEGDKGRESRGRSA
jgi:PAS domain S-box-containing protein